MHEIDQFVFVKISVSVVIGDFQLRSYTFDFLLLRNHGDEIISVLDQHSSVCSGICVWVRNVLRCDVSSEQRTKSRYSMLNQLLTFSFRRLRFRHLRLHLHIRIRMRMGSDIRDRNSDVGSLDRNRGSDGG